MPGTKWLLELLCPRHTRMRLNSFVLAVINSKRVGAETNSLPSHKESVNLDDELSLEETGEELYTDGIYSLKKDRASDTRYEHVWNNSSLEMTPEMTLV